MKKKHRSQNNRKNQLPNIELTVNNDGLSLNSSEHQPLTSEEYSDNVYVDGMKPIWLDGQTDTSYIDKH